MLYKIIITKNGKRHKLLYEGKDYEKSKDIYFNEKDNNIVLMPKKYNANRKMKPVEYELLFLKEREENDSQFFEKDELGRNVPVSIKNDKWTILYKCEYKYEEKFTVFGFDERVETKVIIKKILLKRRMKDRLKQVNYVLNKLLIHHTDGFEVILCKTEDDARRLHNILREFCKTNRIKNIMFTGSVNGVLRTEMFKKIVNRTGWTPNKVYRSTTRP
jgi:hypothetical protein